MRDLSKVLQATESLVFRLLTVEGSQEKLVLAIEELCESLRTSRRVPTFALRTTDAEFEKLFSKYRERRASVQRYVLARLEQQHLASITPGGKPAHVLAKSAANWQVEHILPQTLSTSPKRVSEWSWWRSRPSEKDARINRIGNLLPLEQSLNGAVNNYSFEAKTTGRYPVGGRKFRAKARQFYGDSRIALVRLLLDQGYPKWTGEEMDNWQAELAKLAVKCWHI